MGGIRDVGRGPDVIEPAPLVGGVPVLRAVGPPAIEQPVGNIGAGDIDPTARLLRVAQMLHLDRRVADHLQKLLVRPDVILARGDVQVADKDAFLGSRVPEPVPHLGQEIELVAEFRVLVAVRLVSAGGDVEIVDRRAVLQPRGDVAGIALFAEIAMARVLQRQFRQDRDAVVALLPARHHVPVAGGGEDLGRDLLDRALAFLQAQDIRRLLGQEFHDKVGAQSDGVDVPGGKREGHR
jgi:hypothetical protein